ncbi:MAG: type II toxin-antitoxin system HicA family toxin [bacterium]
MAKITPVHYRILIKIFEQENFMYSRTKGDHIIYVKPCMTRPLVIPMYSEVPVFIIKNLLRTARVDRERYFELLED